MKRTTFVYETDLNYSDNKRERKREIDREEDQLRTELHAAILSLLFNQLSYPVGA